LDVWLKGQLQPLKTTYSRLFDVCEQKEECLTKIEN